MRTRMLTAIPLLLFTLASGGCHHVFGSRSVRVDGWKIQDNNEVYVIQRASHFPAWADSELTYVDVVLETRSGGRVVHRRTLARREQSELLEEGRIKLGILEARSNAERNRVWIVDKNSQRVIASHDRLTKITTGLDEQAPSWASPAEGVMLERAAGNPKGAG